MNWFFTIIIGVSSLAYASNYTHHASIALQEKKADVAIALLEQALQENHNNHEALLLMAKVQFLTHHYDDAARYFEQAIALDPSNAIAQYNCATAYSRSGNFTHAIRLFEQVQTKLQNDKIRGALFKLYIRCQQWDKAIHLQPPSLWWYSENIVGKTVFLDCCKEGNGLGDVIQFVRYAQILTQAGAHVIAKIPTPLHPLLQRCHYIKTILAPHDPPPSYDYAFDICIASLLLTTKDRLVMNACQSPYLSADPELVTAWDQQLAHDHNYKVGLCWNSNLVRDNFTGAIITSPRSISLEDLAPLAHPTVSFYSLQKTAKPPESPFPLNQYTDDFDESHGRFMDTAALIMNMDLIITVDTSIAHLAGALGKEVWLLLACESDYRWFTDSNQSPLYPSMQLFRQTAYRQWENVIQTVTEKLHKRINH